MPEREVITRPAVDPALVAGKPAPPAPAHVVEELEGLMRERDIAVALRDGTRIRVDVYRPAVDAADLPVLLAWGPYGKHWVSDRTFPGSGVDPEWISPLTGFEAPDPVYWVAHGYAVAYADPRGLWYSEGDFPHNGPQERDDLYDLIEWLGAQPWSNGNVGMLGVSYLAGSQYQAAAVQPPSLKAISPWECFTDWYREFATHGGIPETGFRPRVSTNVSYGLSRTEDTGANMDAHPLNDEYYHDKYGDISLIDVPAYVVASWSDHGLHSRGTLRAFTEIGSPDKWLEVHGQKKWAYFYEPGSVERQRQFFDTYLKGEDAGLSEWPRVRIEVRDTGDPADSEWTALPEWPPAEANTELFADFAAAALVPEAPAATTQVSVDPMASDITLSHVFDHDTDVIGPMSMRVWLRADDADDADVFVAVRKFDADGAETRFPFNALFSDGPVALGWLRASHRSLDDTASTALVPVHPHDSEHLLEPGKTVPLEIEIWPSATRFHAGERLAVTIQGRDFVKRPPREGVPPLQILHEDVRNRGTWTLFSSPEQPSILRLPLL